MFCRLTLKEPLFVYIINEHQVEGNNGKIHWHALHFILTRQNFYGSKFNFKIHKGSYPVN